MEHRLSSMLAVLILAILVLLIYEPLLEIDRSASSAVHTHQTDSMQPGIEGTLSFCSDSRPPYVNLPGGGSEGYFIDLLQEIYEPLGYKVTLEITPWDLCLEAVESGRTTGAIGARRQETPGLVFPVETLGQFRPHFYTLSRSGWTYQGLKTLQAIRLGVLTEHSYSDELDEHIDQFRKTDRITLRKGEQAFELLLNDLQEGRLDALLADPLTVDVFMGKNPEIKQNLRVAGSLTTDERLYVAFSTEDESSLRLRQSYDRRINKFRESGFLATFLDRYDLKDWQQSPVETTRKQF